MGSVWSAEDSETGQLVALKFVKDTGAPKLHRRLIREAKAACAVKHPCVVQVHDILELDDGAPVMVMEFLVGESLADRLERDKEIPLSDLACIMQQVVSAVGTAHSLGVVHRDLKPENIFLIESDTGQSKVKILDFGIAKLAPSQQESAPSTELTRTGSLLGTPCYMAPEQVYGEKDVDYRADIWALGVILYQALSGILPTRADNMGQVMKIITTRRIWPLEEAAPDLPQNITAIVNRMLTPEREDRPQGLADVREVLANHTDVDTPSFADPIHAEPESPEVLEQRRAEQSFRPKPRTPAPDGTLPSADRRAATVVEGKPSQLLSPERTEAKKGPWGYVVATLAVFTVAAWWLGPTFATRATATGKAAVERTARQGIVTTTSAGFGAPEVAESASVAEISAHPPPRTRPNTRPGTKPPAAPSAKAAVEPPKPPPSSTSIGGVVLDNPF